MDHRSGIEAQTVCQVLSEVGVSPDVVDLAQSRVSRSFHTVSELRVWAEGVAAGERLSRAVPSDPRPLTVVVGEHVRELVQQLELFFERAKPHHFANFATPGTPQLVGQIWPSLWRSANANERLLFVAALDANCRALCGAPPVVTFVTPR